MNKLFCISQPVRYEAHTALNVWLGPVVVTSVQKVGSMKYTAFDQSEVSFYAQVWQCACKNNTHAHICTQTQTGILIKMWTNLSHKQILSWNSWYPGNQLWQKNFSCLPISHSIFNSWLFRSWQCHWENRGNNNPYPKIIKTTEFVRHPNRLLFQIRILCHYLMFALQMIWVSTTQWN